MPSAFISRRNSNFFCFSSPVRPMMCIFHSFKESVKKKNCHRIKPVDQSQAEASNTESQAYDAYVQVMLILKSCSGEGMQFGRYVLINSDHILQAKQRFILHVYWFLNTIDRKSILFRLTSRSHNWGSIRWCCSSLIRISRLMTSILVRHLSNPRLSGDGPNAIATDWESSPAAAAVVVVVDFVV